MAFQGRYVTNTRSFRRMTPSKSENMSMPRNHTIFTWRSVPGGTTAVHVSVPRAAQNEAATVLVRPSLNCVCSLSDSSFHFSSRECPLSTHYPRRRLFLTEHPYLHAQIFGWGSLPRNRPKGPAIRAWTYPRSIWLGTMWNGTVCELQGISKPRFTDDASSATHLDRVTPLPSPSPSHIPTTNRSCPTPRI